MPHLLLGLYQKIIFVLLCFYSALLIEFLDFVSRDNIVDFASIQKEKEMNNCLIVKF